MKTSIGEEDQQRFSLDSGRQSDALPGNSGGAALTAQGEFFGVVHSIRKGGGDQAEQRPFMGEDPEYPWHSKLTNCGAVNDFLSH